MAAETPPFKTIFLLDCSHSFRKTDCGKKYEIELPKKGQNYLPLAPITKSLYTCAVEAVFEYCRIVWDLFPGGERMIKVSCCLNDFAKTVNSWDVAQQNYQTLHDSFGRLSDSLRASRNREQPNEPATLNYLTNGFAAELDSLSTAASADSLNNSARVIIITCLEKGTVEGLQEKIRNTFEEHKQMSQEARAKINHLDVIVINTVPAEQQKQYYFDNVPCTKLPGNLTFTVHSLFSGHFVSTKLTTLAFDHFDLASSTVSGIPMKEEQNAGSSANYDVEIVHSRKVHTQFFTLGPFDSKFNNLDLYYAIRNGQEYKTLILKWCTPKSSAVELNNCMGAYRITAVDVNSRPSSCLINFLHTGKTVNLEMTRSKTNKVISHMLQSHNGELFIHVLSCTKSLIDDPPSISEGVGGRVTDYRINEFGEFMRRHRLVKLDDPPGENSLEQAKQMLKKWTQYWPISLGFTVLFNIRDQIQTFYQLISKERLTDQDVIEMKNMIYNLATNESKGVSLPIQSNIVRSKGMKKEDMYRILWHEMEHIIRCFNETPMHQSVLNCLLDVKPKGCDANTIAAISQMTADHGGINGSASLKNGDTLGSDVNGERQFGAQINLNNIVLCSDSVHSMYMTKLAQKTKRRREFMGRLEGPKVKLYKELSESRPVEEKQ